MLFSFFLPYSATLSDPYIRANNYTYVKFYSSLNSTLNYPKLYLYACYCFVSWRTFPGFSSCFYFLFCSLLWLSLIRPQHSKKSKWRLICNSSLVLSRFPNSNNTPFSHSPPTIHPLPLAPSLYWSFFLLPFHVSSHCLSSTFCFKLFTL